MKLSAKIFYCEVDTNYLNKLFGVELAKLKKLTIENKRPLVAFSINDSEYIVIPENTYVVFQEKTYHGNDKIKFGKFNFNFKCEVNRYLDVGSYFFVPKKYINTNPKLHFKNEDLKINELIQRFYVLQRLIKQFNRKMDVNIKFKNSHPYIKNSLDLCKKENNN